MKNKKLLLGLIFSVLSLLNASSQNIFILDTCTNKTEIYWDVIVGDTPGIYTPNFYINKNELLLECVDSGILMKEGLYRIEVSPSVGFNMFHENPSIYFCFTEKKYENDNEVYLRNIKENLLTNFLIQFAPYTIARYFKIQTQKKYYLNILYARYWGKISLSGLITINKIK